MVPLASSVCPFRIGARSRFFYSVAFMFAAVVLCVTAGAIAQQVADPNVNIVRGVKLPDGDPYLQRQNEPSLAISTRNPCHLLAGANDYRRTDMPDPSFMPGIDPYAAGDAWLGLFWSTDCGARWKGTLLHGYPEDTRPEAQGSPLRGFAAAADPTVRAGTNGLFYYSGIAFNRGDNAQGRLFMARYIDENNKEQGNPFRFLGITVIAEGTAGQFHDKPWMAVDVPRAGFGPAAAFWASDDTGEHLNPGQSEQSSQGMCEVDGKQVPGGNVYMAWARFEGSSARNPSKIMFARSTDCGRTFQSRPISDNSKVSQGAMIAIAPDDGTVYVAWREFGRDGKPHSIHIVRSRDGGKSWDKPQPVIASFSPFDQPKGYYTFRSNALPTIAAAPGGFVYVAIAARGFGHTTNLDRTVAETDDARVVLAVSSDAGMHFSAPYAVDDHKGRRGHQIMPALAYAAGRLQLVFYDFRDDISPTPTSWVTDDPAANPPVGGKALRHTVDVRGGWAMPGSQPSFGVEAGTTKLLSRYAFSATKGTVQLNYVNLPMYAKGEMPFIGDYIDVQGLTALPVRNADGTQGWRPNMPSLDAAGLSALAQGTFTSLPIFHAAWTDQRDVRFVKDASVYKLPPELVNCDPEMAGLRNSNIYTLRLNDGLFAGATGNTKPFGTYTKAGQTRLLQRTFAVFVQNTTASSTRYKLTIANQPTGGRASFRQFDRKRDPNCEGAYCPTDPLTVIDADIKARSTIARTVYATSTEKYASILVNVEEVGGAGRKASVLLNPDNTNPDILQPDINIDENDPTNIPQIAQEETHDPSLSLPIFLDLFGALTSKRALAVPKNPDPENPDPENPGAENPDPENPDPENPDPENPDPENPDPENPDPENPDPENPDPENPDPENPDPENESVLNTAIGADEEIAAMRDVHWTVKNRGNTTSAYYFNPMINGDVSAYKFQMLVTKRYLVPVVVNTVLDNENPKCRVKYRTESRVIVNIPGYQPQNPDPENPDPENPDPENPDPENPDPENPDPENPDPENPDPENPDPENVTFMLAPDESATVTLRIFKTRPKQTTTANDDETGGPSATGAQIEPPPPESIHFSPRERTAAQVSAQAANTGERYPRSDASGPDLITSAPVPSASPALVPAGGVFTLNFGVTNRGDAPATNTVIPGGPLKTRFYLSGDPILDRLDTPLGSPGTESPVGFFYPIGAPIGVCANVETPTSACQVNAQQLLVLPAGVTPGQTYYVFVITDDDNDADDLTSDVWDNEFFESNDYNNRAFATITITAPTGNLAPAAADNTYQIASDTTLSVPAPGILGNDTDPDSGPLPLRAVRGTFAGPGTLVLTSDGAFTYTPPAGFTGEVQFTYTASDGELASNIATVRINVVGPLTLTSPNPVQGILFQGLNPLQASGGTANYTFAVTGSNPLPRGLTLNANGSFSGTVQEAGRFVVTVQVTDASVPPQLVTGVFTFLISAQDQHSAYVYAPPGTISFGAMSGRRLAQVFTAGISANVTGVEPNPLRPDLSRVGITCPAGRFVDVTLEGVTGTPPRPNGVPMASGSGVPTGPIELSPWVFVPAESRYAIVVSTTALGADCTATASATNFYGAGEGWAQTGGGGWEPLNASVVGYDLELTTLVMPTDLAYAEPELTWGSSATRLSDGRVLLIYAGDPNVVIYDPATRGFTPAGTMHFARRTHTATAVPDGRVLVAGGVNTTGAALANVELFDLTQPVESRFTLIGGLLPRARHTATLLAGGTQVLIAGGQWYPPPPATDWTGQQEAQIFDIASGSFMSAGLMAAEREGHTATLLQDGSVLFVGGWLFARSTTVAEVYRPVETPRFRPIAGPTPAYRSEHTATRLPDGRVLFAGGVGIWPKLITSYEIYDPATETFENAGSMAIARTAHTATLLPDGSVLIAGGATEYGTSAREGWAARVERFVLGSGVIAAAPLNVTRAYHVAEFLDADTLLMIGGRSDSAMTARSIEEYNVAPDGFAITTATLPDGRVGEPYARVALQTTGGTPPITFAIDTGALPDGLTIDATGTVAGTPTTAGAFQFVVRATDGAIPAHVARQPFAVFVNRLVVTTATLPNGVIGAPYSVQLEASGTGTKAWSLANYSTLPAGLSLSADGLISGTPSLPTWSHFVVQVTDSVGLTAYGSFELRVVDALVLDTSSVSDFGVLGSGYGMTLQAHGGVPPYLWAVSAGSLPPGLALNSSTGRIAGPVTDVGIYPFTISVTDASVPLQNISNAYTIRVGMIDQSYSRLASPASYMDITETSRVAQIFRGGVESEFLAVLAPIQCFNGDLLVSMYEVGNGEINLSPDASEIAQFTIPGGQFPVFTGSPSLRQLRLRASFHLLLDTRYAIVLSSTGNCQIARMTPGISAYEDGEGFSELAGEWIRLSATDPSRHDFPFATLVAPYGGPYSFIEGAGYSHTLSPLNNGPYLFTASQGGRAYTYDPTTGAFTPTAGRMRPNRSDYTATPLLDGRVLLLGGLESGNVVTTAEYYNPIERTFTTLASGMLRARMGHTATRLYDGNVLIAGGESPLPGGDFQTLRATEIFHPADNSFSPGPDMTCGRQEHTATRLLDNRVLIAGGWGGCGDTAELYTPLTNSFAPTLGGLSPLLVRHRATLLNDGRVLLSGGVETWMGDEVISSRVYDPSTDTFLSTAPMIEPRQRHTATLSSDGKVLLGGGEHTRAGRFLPVSSVELFNPETNAFEPREHLDVSRDLAASALLPSGEVLVAGGALGPATQLASMSAETVGSPGAGVFFPTNWLPDAVQSQHYHYNLLLAGDTAPYIFTLDAGTWSAGMLPPGITLYEGGTLDGTPTASGTFDFVVLGQAASGASSVRAFTIYVAQPLQMTAVTLPAGTVNTPYTASVGLQGGFNATYVEAIGLPAGLTTTYQGIIQGTPTTPGTYGIVVNVSDQSRPRQTTSRTFTIQINP